jgi:hypothetical protein
MFSLIPLGSLEHGICHWSCPLVLFSGCCSQCIWLLGDAHWCCSHCVAVNAFGYLVMPTGVVLTVLQSMHLASWWCPLVVVLTVLQSMHLASWWCPLVVVLTVLQSMHLASCLCFWYFEGPQSRIGVITLVVSGALQKWVDVRMVHFHKMYAACRYQSWQASDYHSW